MDEFRLFELEEIMRQKDDQTFAKLLSRVRTATCNRGDITILESREISKDNPSYPTRCLHTYRLNRDVDQRNIMMLNALAPESEHVSITAIDHTKDTHITHLTIKMPTSKAKTGGLVGELTLAVGAEVMLTINIDVNDGLVNGARGKVAQIIASGDKVNVVLVNFKNPRVGNTARLRGHYRQEQPHAVPIHRHKATFCVGRHKTVEVSRTQFPLVLSWASTIHKVQGLTLDNIVVDMKGGKFLPGQAYVAFSRVRTLDSLFICNFNPASITADKHVVSEIERLHANTIPQESPLHILSEAGDISLKIGHLNVHSYIAKEEDISCNQCV